MSETKSPLPAISDLDLAGVTALVAELGLEKYRSAQILDAVWRSDATTWAGVTTLSKRAQETLAAVARFYSTETVEREDVEDGATTKLLITLSGGAKVEAVLMRYPPDPRRGRGERATICVSSQAGCAVAAPSVPPANSASPATSPPVRFKTRCDSLGRSSVARGES
jgi:23S rRNA (adenine2503-C2)-methyltransferase